MALSATQQAARKSGYVRDPNCDTRWYAGGPGLPSLPNVLFEVHIETPQVKAGDLPQSGWPVALYGLAYGPKGDKFLMKRFPTWEQFIEWIKGLTLISEPGQPANVWD